MKKLLPIITAVGVVASLASAIYLGQINEFSFAQVTVKFCPQTANKNRKNGEKSQAKLDQKYCRYRHRLLKEVWEAEQFKSAIPLSEGSFSIQEFRGDNSGGVWLLLAPVLAGSAYLSWSNKSQADYDSKFEQLEGLKSYFKLITVAARNEREFKATVINQSWDKQRVKAGQISVDAVQDRLRRQSEIQDRTHTSTLKQFDLNDNQINKQIAENQLIIAEASKKVDKLLRINLNDEITNQNPTKSLKASLIDALTSHEDGYLWKIISSLKPLWLIGNQGSGKTYTAAAIALIRKYCLDAPIHQLIDRHATGDNADVWKLLEAASKAESEYEISTAFDECCDRWLNRIKQKPTTKQQVIVDEFTNLKSLCGESAIAFFKMSLTDTRKAKEYLLGITHNATNESFPDGTASSRKSGTVLLEKFSANGETPLKRVVVRYGLVDEQGNNLDDVEKTLPDWLHPEKIYQHFNGKSIEL
jgi:hypothetical protein